jgi:hypothetical protein
MECSIGEVQRTKLQQAAYMAAGKSWTMRSKHLEKCAVDLFLWIDNDVTWKHEDYQVLADYWKTLHPRCKWGGDWKRKDSVHFEVD